MKEQQEHQEEILEEPIGEEESLEEEKPEKKRELKPDNYFEGVLQLRDVDQEIVDFVEDACIMSFVHLHINGRPDHLLPQAPPHH